MDMNSLIDSIVAGVIAALISTAFILVLQVFYRKAIRPKIEEMLYRDLKIEGQWTIEYLATDGFSETAIIERNGHVVTGIVTCSQGMDHGRTYSVRGDFKNLILTLTFEGKEKSTLDRGTFSLKVADNGRTLRGYSAFYFDDEDKIASKECFWRRTTYDA